MRSDACIVGSKAHKQIDITIIRIRTPSQDCTSHTDLRTTPPTVVLVSRGLAPPQLPGRFGYSLAVPGELRVARGLRPCRASALDDFAGQNLGGSAKPIISAHHKALGRSGSWRCPPVIAPIVLCTSCSHASTRFSLRARSGVARQRHSPGARRWVRTMAKGHAPTPAVAQHERRAPTTPVGGGRLRPAGGCPEQKKPAPCKARGWLIMVPGRGFEPPLPLQELEPESSASANSATRAGVGYGGIMPPARAGILRSHGQGSSGDLVVVVELLCWGRDENPPRVSSTPIASVAQLLVGLLACQAMLWVCRLPSSKENCARVRPLQVAIVFCVNSARAGWACIPLP